MVIEHMFDYHAGMSELEILRRSAVMAPVGSRVPVNREVLLSLIAAAEPRSASGDHEANAQPMRRSEPPTQ